MLGRTIGYALIGAIMAVGGMVLVHAFIAKHDHDIASDFSHLDEDTGCSCDRCTEDYRSVPEGEPLPHAVPPR